LADSSAYGVLALLAAGIGFIFLWTDWGSRPSRALALCFILIGLRAFLTPFEFAASGSTLWLLQALLRLAEGLAILFGIEWARRVGLNNTGRPRVLVNTLFRVSQGLAMIYGLMSLGYLAIAPEAASSHAEGMFRVHALEWAVFAPVLGLAILLAAIALLVVRFTRRDKIESIRLLALAAAAPFLLGALVVESSLVPIVTSAGLLIFLSGSVRYLIVQNQRGQAMRQFLSPEVAKLLSTDGVESAMRREKRTISVVVCDLRNFTAYAQAHPSEQVISLLERYYRHVGSVAAVHGGTVKDHAGDGILILVGAPLPDADHVRKAVRLALNLNQQLSAFLREVAPELGIGIGVATGETTVGAIRGAGRYEYVAVGSAVNLASRLCQRATDGEVLAELATAEALQASPQFEAMPQASETLKGFNGEVAVFAIRQRASSAQ
jgi:adenylate cyclase